MLLFFWGFFDIIKGDNTYLESEIIMVKQFKMAIPVSLAAISIAMIYDSDHFYVHADGRTIATNGGRDLVEKAIKDSPQTVYVHVQYTKPNADGTYPPNELSPNGQPYIHWSTGTANAIGNRTLVTAAHLFLDWGFDRFNHITGVDFFIGADSDIEPNKGAPT